MPRILSEDQVRRFREQGYLAPIRAIEEGQALDMRRRLEEFEKETGHFGGSLEIKVHLYFAWLWSVWQSPGIVGALQDLLGPDLFVLASRFWIKNPKDRKHVTWHQDLAYFRIDPPDMITLWMALTPTNLGNGCMSYIPGSHKQAGRVHDETDDKDNMLSRGQVVRGVDESKAVPVLLQPGEFSLHHGETLHASGANSSDDRRIGTSLMVFPTHAKSTLGRRSVTLLCGEDRYGYWDHDPMPTRDRDPVIWELMQEANRRYQDKSIKQEALSKTGSN